MEERVSILVVDDESALANLMACYLTRFGHEVRTCPAAAEALEVFGQRPLSFSLVIADVQMPGMNGQEMVARMRELNPQVRAVLTSGYPLSALPCTLELADRERFLQKPFSPAQLVAVIEEVLKA